MPGNLLQGNHKQLMMSAVLCADEQWVEILETIQRVIRWCDLDAVDPIMSTDVALRLGLLYESAALLRTGRDPPGTAD